MIEKVLHPIVAQKGLKPGTPEAVLAVAEVFVKMKYEDDKKNKDNIFGRYMDLNHTAWCAEFVSYCFQKAGAGKLIEKVQTPKGYVGCGAGIRGMTKKGWKKIPVAQAQPGDVIFFDWDHNHDPDHTGIVLKNDPKKKIVTCREGNTSRGDGSRSNGGQVAQRPRNYSVVFAVFRPDWASLNPVATKPAVAAPVTPVATPTVAATAPVIPANIVAGEAIIPANVVVPAKLVKPKFVANMKKGSKGANVKYIQARLKVAQTGIFDQATHNAVVTFQKRLKLTADGIVGPVTWSRF
jgi:peptidoglycan hydrolase-like protein with peptidoglycan-binding domain